MYKVTKRSPTKVVSEEYWAVQLSAEIRRDVINSNCDEFTGAVLEKIIIPDLEETITKKIVVELLTWPNYSSLSDIVFLLHLGNDSTVICQVDVDYELDSGEPVRFIFGIGKLVYMDSESVESSFEPCRDVSEQLRIFFEHHVSENDTFSDYNNSDVKLHIEALSNDNPSEPKTL